MADIAFEKRPAVGIGKERARLFTFPQFSLALYILLVMVAMPLLTPLRIADVLEPAQIRNYLLPPILLFLILAFGKLAVFQPRSFLQIALGLVFIQAAAIGVYNDAHIDEPRFFFSHLFQIFSAYTMIGVGWMAVGRLGHGFWRLFVTLALIATLLASAFTINAYSNNDITHIYTAAYVFIFVGSFSAIYSNRLSFLVFLGILVSNKRGPIVAVVILFLQQIFIDLNNGGSQARARLGRYLFLGVLWSVILAVVSVLVYQWATDNANQQNAIARAINVTFNRLTSIAATSESSNTINQITSGRFIETQIALESLNFATWIFGSGAGWNIVPWGGESVQNIHLTPLSLIAVFGTPFMIILYITLFGLIIRGTLRKTDVQSLTTTERMAPLYLSGAVVHSFIAYSLFVDFLVFFFVGVLLRSFSQKDTELTLNA